MLRALLGLSALGRGESTMHSVLIVVLGIAGMCFGWFVYSKFIASKIYQLDPNIDAIAA